jgi:4-hydroxybenzoate polyprenyltransferase/phosphoserine phosphatase
MAQGQMLVVDLDGTLIRSDMLFETFWAAFSKTWKAPFVSIASLLHGRAALKHRLQGMAQVEVTSLPYNQDVLGYIQHWRAGGGRTALVTASNQTVAEGIAAHLGVFDEVHGSDETTNLKGANKAAFLQDRFGATGFDYIGDAEADLPVWAKAHKAIMVGVSGALAAKVAGMGREVEQLPGTAPSAKSYMKALRPHQWMKNLLVFLPLVAAHKYDLVSIRDMLMAFVAFSLVASSVYVLNDLLDLAADRAHPRKCRRPFASGAIPISHGTVMAPVLLLTGLLLSLPLGWHFLAVIAVYYAITTAYSLYFKRQLIIDICVLAVLYTMRIVAGSVAAHIPPSVWFLAFSIFFFFSLAAVKRQAELKDGVTSGRVKASGRGYQTDDLPLVVNMAIASGYVSVLVMALYVNSPAVLVLYHKPSALWGICLVLLYWISRMVMVTHRGEMHDDPVVFAAKDRVSLLCVALIFGFAALGVIL